MTPLQRYLDPKILRRLSSLTPSARTVVAGTTTGRHRAPVRGSSIEFRQHRFYTPGDEPRRIDWRVLARTDRPYVREYEQETNLRCVLVLDCSGSMAYPSTERRQVLDSKIGYGKRAVAALAYVMLSETESVGLATFGGTAMYVAPHTGQAQLARILDSLDRAGTGGLAGLGGGGELPGGGIGQACVAVANRLARRSYVVVLTDGFEEPGSVARGLARLRHDRHEVTLVRVLHRDETEFPFMRWCRFLGAEGEGARMLEPALARRDYLARFASHRTALSGALRKLGVGEQVWHTDEDLGDAVTNLVYERGVV